MMPALIFTVHVTILHTRHTLNIIRCSMNSLRSVYEHWALRMNKYTFEDSRVVFYAFWTHFWNQPLQAKLTQFSKTNEALLKSSTSVEFSHTFQLILTCMFSWAIRFFFFQRGRGWFSYICDSTEQKNSMIPFEREIFFLDSIGV